MSILIDYVANYAPWIYFICGVVALFQMYRTWHVRAERRQAVFSLEREKAVRDLNSIFSTAMLLLLIMGITYFTSTTLVKALEPLVDEAINPSPEFGFVPTPTNTPLPVTPTPAVVVAPTPILFVTPGLTVTLTLTQARGLTPPVLATPAPTATPAPIVQAAACPDPNAAILRPGMNETVRGALTVVGSASRDAFQYYKIEYAPAGTANFTYLTGDSNPVVNGFLANIDTAALGNGSWTLRLVVVDQTGNYNEPCQVTIFVEN